MWRISPVSVDDPLLSDESRWRYAVPQAIVFPESEADLSSVLKDAEQKNLAVYVQGAKTGLTSASIPSVEHSVLISFEKYPVSVQVDGQRLRASASARLRDIHAAAEAAGCVFPPNPTETSAMLGGALACNASGSRSFAFGPVRSWVKSLKVMLVSGEVIRVERKSMQNAKCKMQYDGVAAATIESNQCDEVASSILHFAFCTLHFEMPKCKNAAGYFSGGDDVDLFIGSEGTLGIILEAELELLPLPQIRLPMIVFFDTEDAAHRFIIDTRDRHRAVSDVIKTVMLEFIGENILKHFPKLTGMPEAANAAVMLEHWSGLNRHSSAGWNPDPSEAEGKVTGSGVGDPSLRWDDSKLRENVRAAKDSRDDNEETLLAAWAEHMMSCGAIPDASDPSFPQILLASDDKHRRDFEAFRHHIPETMNAIVAKAGFPKLATDCAVPDEKYMDVVQLYRSLLNPSGLEWYYFGHAGDNHFHVNLITHNQAEFDLAKQIYFQICQAVVALGGTVSAEHGIGKNKIPYFNLMVPADSQALVQMKVLKKRLDPEWRLNPGTLFS